MSACSESGATAGRTAAVVCIVAAAGASPPFPGRDALINWAVDCSIATPAAERAALLAAVLSNDAAAQAAHALAVRDVVRGGGAAAVAVAQAAVAVGSLGDLQSDALLVPGLAAATGDDVSAIVAACLRTPLDGGARAAAVLRALAECDDPLGERREGGLRAAACALGDADAEVGSAAAGALSTALADPRLTRDFPAASAAAAFDALPPAALDAACAAWAGAAARAVAHRSAGGAHALWLADVAVAGAEPARAAARAAFHACSSALDAQGASELIKAVLRAAGGRLPPADAGTYAAAVATGGLGDALAAAACAVLVEAAAASLAGDGTGARAAAGALAALSAVVADPADCGAAQALAACQPARAALRALVAGGVVGAARLDAALAA